MNPDLVRALGSTTSRKPTVSPAGPKERVFLEDLAKLLGDDMEGDVIDLRGHPKATALWGAAHEEGPMVLERMIRDELQAQAYRRHNGIVPGPRKRGR